MKPFTQEEIINTVRSAIGNELCISVGEQNAIPMNLRIDDLGLDSLNMVNVTQELEDIYNIKFPKSLGKISIVGDLVSYVEKELEAST